MTVVHVQITCAADYVARRAPVRQAHIERLERFRATGALVAGGPAPDGRTVELFYRAPDVRALRAIIEEDPYYLVGGWTGYVPREYETFVDPWDAEPPIVLDGSRPALVVEGPTADRDVAQLALVELRGAARIVFGGFLRDGSTLAVTQTTDPDEAIGWLADTGSWKADDLSTRPWLYVI
ncbi:MAG TPA: YciI family protein [Verrucomicrobiae bacterium]|jgi:uncharacterized protein YciI|nr:YciI family protein [Verrucomicrobiae bacterium]